MMLASVGWAAIPVLRPLTFSVGPRLFNGAGPIAVQATVLSWIVGNNGACNGGRGCVRGVQSVTWWGWKTGA
ncbi:MAG: hypothetical protein DME82_13115 [Verrucomicrobia bacterium]|nr:MAG: hypothetical protein DME82_13115 [Verrucomicrobiota bacterium]